MIVHFCSWFHVMLSLLSCINACLLITYVHYLLSLPILSLIATCLMMTILHALRPAPGPGAPSIALFWPSFVDGKSKFWMHTSPVDRLKHKPNCLLWYRRVKVSLPACFQCWRKRGQKIATSGFLQHEINVGQPLSHIYTTVNNFGAYPLDCQLLKHDANIF